MSGWGKAQRELQLRSQFLGHRETGPAQAVPGSLVCWRTAPPFSHSFLTAELAESFKGELKKAAQRGERFDETTGLPDSMLRKDRDITWYEHAQEYAAAQWKGSAGNSRRSIAESLACVTPVLVRDLRGAPDPDTLRAALRKDFNHGRPTALTPDETKAITWLKRASLPISAVNDDSVVTDVLDCPSTDTEGVRTWARSSLTRSASLCRAGRSSCRLIVLRGVLDHAPRAAGCADRRFRRRPTVVSGPGAAPLAAPHAGVHLGCRDRRRMAYGGGSWRTETGHWQTFRLVRRLFRC